MSCAQGWTRAMQRQVGNNIVRSIGSLLMSSAHCTPRCIHLHAWKTRISVSTRRLAKDQGRPNLHAALRTACEAPRCPGGINIHVMSNKAKSCNEVSWRTQPRHPSSHCTCYDAVTIKVLLKPRPWPRLTRFEEICLVSWLKLYHSFTAAICCGQHPSLPLQLRKDSGSRCSYIQTAIKRQAGKHYQHSLCVLARKEIQSSLICATVSETLCHIVFTSLAAPIRSRPDLQQPVCGHR